MHAEHRITFRSAPRHGRVAPRVRAHLRTEAVATLSTTTKTAKTA